MEMMKRYVLPRNLLLLLLQLQQCLTLSITQVSYLFRKPKVRGMVIFKAPEALQEIGYSCCDMLIKRIVAKEEDFIQVKDAKLMVDGIVQDVDFVLKPLAYEMEPVLVPKSYVFTMGDNRNHRFDSHDCSGGLFL